MYNIIRVSYKLLVFFRDSLSKCLSNIEVTTKKTVFLYYLLIIYFII